MTIDNMVNSIEVGGETVQASGNYADWTDVKTFSFPDANTVLAIKGEEAGHCNGCSCSGLSLVCTSTRSSSPWNGFKSSPSNFQAFGSDNSDATPAGFGSNLAGDAPCQSSSPFHLAGFNSATKNQNKIWAANGGKYAWFSANAYVAARKAAIAARKAAIAASKAAIAESKARTQAAIAASKARTQAAKKAITGRVEAAKKSLQKRVARAKEIAKRHTEWISKKWRI